MGMEKFTQFLQSLLPLEGFFRKLYEFHMQTADQPGPFLFQDGDFLSLETGRQLGVMLPVGSLYLQFLLQAQFNGWGRDDATVVMRIYEQLAGVKRRGKKS